MSGPLRHVADLVRFAANRRARERDDAEALVELEGRTGELELAPGLEIEWLGVAGYRLTYEGVALLIDPYVSRVPLRNLLRRIPALPDPALLDRWAAAGPATEWPACSSGTRTSTTRWTRPRSPAAPAPALRLGARSLR